MDFKEFSEGTGSLKPGWMLKKDPELAKKLKDQQDRKKFVAGEPTKKEDMEESHVPVAPVPDKKYIKGTPENKALKALRKPINGMPTNKMKEENMPQSFKGFLTSLTELTDKQKQLDKNKNGKLDGQDFKMLRNEDDMGEESHQSKTTMKHIPNASPALKKAAKDIKPGVSGYRDRIAMLKAGNVKEEAEENSAKDKKEDKAAMKRSGMTAKEWENSDEDKKQDKKEMKEAMINGREYASHGLMHPDHAKMDIHQKANREVDFYASKTGDKMNGKVMKNDGKEVHIQAHKQLGDGKLHKFKVTPNLPKTTNEDHKKDDIPFDGPYKKVTGDGSVKDKSGAVHTPMSRARDLARKAMQQKMKEDFNIEISEEQAADLCDVAIINEKMDMSKADMGDVIKDFQKSDAPQFAGKSKEKRREMAIAAKMKSENTMKSYKDFVTEIKMSDLPSRTVKGTSYGAQYHDPEGDDHADDRKPKASKPTDATKRGRGRPSGSKSGAKQQGSEKSSNYGGIDRTTYALRLPNNNK